VLGNRVWSEVSSVVSFSAVPYRLCCLRCFPVPIRIIVGFRFRLDWRLLAFHFVCCVTLTLYSSSSIFAILIHSSTFYVHGRHSYRGAPRRDVFIPLITQMGGRCLYRRNAHINIFQQIKLHGPSPRANYTDRATAACRRSDCQLLRIEGATWTAWRIPSAVFSVF
jgi:hypothetical protein